MRVLRVTLTPFSLSQTESVGCFVCVNEHKNAFTIYFSLESVLSCKVSVHYPNTWDDIEKLLRVYSKELVDNTHTS